MSRSRSRMLSALDGYRAVVGSAHVITDPGALGESETATYRTRQSVAAIVRPASRSEVQRSLIVANRFRTPVWPISRGKNWGYGSRVPVETGSVILDLARMDRILEVNRKLAYATVEPGVTFRALCEHLERIGARLAVNVTGGPPDGSLIGNAMDRGLGTGPYWDRASHMCNLEVVLPTGECIRTGFGRFETSPLGPLHRHGVGPSLDGLFTQSNLGIVTSATTWLAPRPDSAASFSFEVRSPAALVPAIDALQSMFLAGELTSPVRILNDYRAYATFSQRADQDRRRALSSSVLRSAGLPRWIGLGSQGFPSRRARVAGCELLRHRLAGLVDELSVIAHRPGAAMHGTSDVDIRTTYFRKASPPPSAMDPDRDGCGVIWFSPLVPADGRAVRRAVELARAVVGRHGLEPMVTIVCNNPRAVYLTIPIVFDRSRGEEEGRALRCFAALERLFAARGLITYRQSTIPMARGRSPRDPHARFLRDLKRKLDPNRILAPGRYIG